jgi:hypothetical protein
MVGKIHLIPPTAYKRKTFWMPRYTKVRDSCKQEFKPTNKFQYTSLPSTFEGVVKSEAVRILRLSSDSYTYKKTCMQISS